MRGRCIVIGGRQPIGEHRHNVESFGWQWGRRRQLILRLLQGDAVQPDDVLIVVCELGMVAIVRRHRVRLQVPVNGRAGMVSVGLVHVLWRHRRREGEVGRQYEADSGPA